LVAGPRDLPPRQRSLRAALDWSWELLDPIEARTLVQLALFPGGWTVEAAEAVCEPSGYKLLEAVARLLDKNLIYVNNTGRFSMLHIVREYAVEKLQAHGYHEEAQNRFVSWALRFAYNLRDRSAETPASQWQLVGEFEAELPNLSAALEQLERAGDVEKLADNVAAIGPFWYMAGRLTQGEHWLKAALAKSPPTRNRAALLASWGWHVLLADAEPVKAERFLHRALEAYAQVEGQIEVKLSVRGGFANSLRWQGRLPEACQAREQLVADALAADLNELTVAIFRMELAEVYDDLGWSTLAWPLALEYLQVSVAAKSIVDEAYATAAIALLSVATGKPDASAHVIRCVELCEHAEVLDVARADILEMIGIVELGLRHWEAARRLLIRAAAAMLRTGYRLPLADTLCAIGIALSKGEQPNPEMAATFFGAGSHMRQRSGLGMVYRQLREAHAQAVEEVTNSLTPSVAEACWNRGRVISQSSVNMTGLLNEAHKD